jgi:hypothetical protein
MFATFLAFSVFSTLLIQPFNDHNSFQTNFFDKENSSLGNFDPRFKLNQPIGGSFAPGGTLTVEQFLDRRNDTNAIPAVPSDIFWPIPEKEMEIYMIDETDSTNKLEIIGGDNLITTGVDNAGGFPNNFDDNWGYINTTSDPGDYNTVLTGRLAGYYHIQVQIPNQTFLQSKGITDTLKIIEYFPGNASTGLSAWINAEYDVSLVNTASITPVSGTPTPKQILSDGNTTIDFELRFDNGGSVIPNINISSLSIYNGSDSSLICSDSCSSNPNFSVTYFNTSMTDLNGIVTVTIQMSTPPVVRGTYWVNVTADTDAQYSNTPTGSAIFDIVWNNATLALDMIPIDVMKPHESKLINVNLTSDYDGSPINGKQLSFEITYENNGTFICNAVAGCLIRGFNITDPVQTDVTGLANYTLTTNYQIVADLTYTFSVTVTTPFDPDSTPFFITNNPLNSVDVVIDRDPKIGMLEFLGNSPNNVTKFRPTENVSLNFLTKTDKNATYQNVPIIVELWNMSGIPIVIGNGAGNLWYFSTFISDGSGNVVVNLISNSTNTPTGVYRINVTADYTGFLGIDQYLQNSYSSPYQYDFEIDYQYDWIDETITTVPAPPETQPTSGGSSIVVNINLQRNYNSSWINYNGPKSPDPINQMRIRPYFISNSSGIVMTINTGLFPESDVSSYYLTDANGDLTVTITSTYPLTYEFITKTISFELGINNTETPFLSYFNSTLGMYVNNPQYNQLITIDPDYNIIDVFPASTPTNETADLLTLGKAIEIYFETKNGSNLLGNVPVRFEITTGALSGVYLAFQNGTKLNPYEYIYSDGSGQITILMRSTYGVTIESTTLMFIEVTATANITLFNNITLGGDYGSIPGPPFHIGELNTGTSNFALFSNTWSTTTLTINHVTSYTIGEASWDSDDSNDEIRPGESINVSLTVVLAGTQSAFYGFFIPVNATIQCFVSEVLTPCSTIGVSFNVADTSANPLSYPNYYNTTINGVVTFTLTSTYNPSFPESFKVRFNAILDFENKSRITDIFGTQFFVGHTTVGGFNRSQASYSTNEYFNMTFNPQYRTASVSLDSVSIPSLGGGNTLVPTDEGVTVEVTFIVTLDNGAVPIGNVNVTLNLTLLAEQNVTVIGQTWGFTDSSGLVTFDINVTTATFDGWYTVQAFADFLNDNLLTPPQDVDNDNRLIAYQWINGTGFEPTSNSAYTVNTYQVLRLRLMTVNILAVYDTIGTLVSTGPSDVIAYRDYVLELNVTYVLDDFTPVTGLQGFKVYYNQSLNQTIELNSDFTSDGSTVFNTTLDTGLGTIYPGAAQLYANPTDVFFNDPAQTFFQPFNFQIRSTPTIVWNTPPTDVSNTDTLKDGDAITVGGTFIDELGLPLTNTNYLTSALNELNNNLLVYGLEDLTANVTSNLNATGGFEIVYIIPNGYSNENITLWFEIADNSSIETFDLTNSFIQTLFTYQYLTIDLDLDSFPSNSPFPVLNLTNNTVSSITSNTQAFDATITILDNYGRVLQNFQFNVNDNSSIVARTTNASGQVVYSISPSPEYVNSTRDFDLSYENGTVSMNLLLNITRTVYDTTAPNIEFIQPSPPNSSYLYDNFTVEIDAYDYNSSDGIVTAGFNQGSLIILHNGTPVTPGNWIDGDTYLYVFDFTNTPFSETAVNITIILTDNAGLVNQTSLIVTFDRFAPVFNSINPANLSYPYGIGPVNVDVTDIGQFVNDVEVRVIILANGTDSIFPLTQIDASNWQGQISFDNMPGDANLIFTATDIAGNIVTLNYTYLMDATDPGISIVSIDRNGNPFTPGTSDYFSPSENVIIVVDVTEAESGVSTNNFLINSLSQTNVTQQGSLYTITFQPPSVNTSQLQTLGITDRAGNPASILLFTILYDNIFPIITINTPTNNNAYYNTFSIDFNVTDLQTSVNVTSVQLIDKDGSILNLSVVSIDDGYRFSFDATPDYNSSSASQNYNITARDLYDNQITSGFTIFTDVNAAEINNPEIKHSEESNYTINPINYNVTGSHDVIFTYSDTGLYENGIDNIELRLSYLAPESASFVEVSYEDYNISLDSNLARTTINWITEYATDTEVLEGQYKWTLIVTDNVGHESTLEFVYTIEYIKPTLIDTLISVGTTLLLSIGVFGGLAVIVAYAYEKIRYE